MLDGFSSADSSSAWALLCGPETPLILIAMGVVLCARWWRPANWWKLALAILWVGAGLILPLSPWAARNVLHVGHVQFLAPTHAETPGDRVPPGFYDWTQTWMVKFRDAYNVSWKLNKQPIAMDVIPDYAFDSDAERAQVARMMDEYNKRVLLTPTLNFQFTQLAKERAARHPVRTYVIIPIERAWWIWFTPRLELLPYSGKLWPVQRSLARQRNRVQRNARTRHLELCLRRHGAHRRLEIPSPRWSFIPARVFSDSHRVLNPIADSRAPLRNRVLPRRAGTLRARLGSSAHGSRFADVI